MISCSSFFAFLFSFTLHAAVPASAAAFVRLLHPATARSRAVSTSSILFPSQFSLPQILHGRPQRPRYPNGEADVRNALTPLYVAQCACPTPHLSGQPPQADAFVFSILPYIVFHPRHNPSIFFRSHVENVRYSERFLLTYCNTARNMLFFNYQPCVYVATWQKDDT